MVGVSERGGESEMKNEAPGNENCSISLLVPLCGEKGGRGEGGLASPPLFAVGDPCFCISGREGKGNQGRGKPRLPLCRHTLAVSPTEKRGDSYRRENGSR